MLGDVNDTEDPGQGCRGHIDDAGLLDQDAEWIRGQWTRMLDDVDNKGVTGPGCWVVPMIRGSLYHDAGSCRKCGGH